MANKKTDEQAFVLADAMNEVEDLIGRMEDPECSLEDSFAYYSKGVGLLKKCSESIDKVEKEIEILEEG